MDCLACNRTRYHSTVLLKQYRASKILSHNTCGKYTLELSQQLISQVTNATGFLQSNIGRFAVRTPYGVLHLVQIITHLLITKPYKQIILNLIQLTSSLFSMQECKASHTLDTQ